MIEINLIEKPKAMKMPVIMGFDIKKIHVPMVIASIVFYNLSSYLLTTYYEEVIASENASLELMTQKNTKLEAEIKKRGAGPKELESYNKQLQEAKLRSSQIDEILKSRSNPKKILEVIARTIPEDVSFEKLSIDLEDNILITGESLETRLIGEFITAINDTPYFGGSVTPTKQEHKQVTINGVQSSVDSFELKGKIKNYDMRSK
jgi:Tfp pilus assembly protein PilN